MKKPKKNEPRITLYHPLYKFYVEFYVNTKTGEKYTTKQDCSDLEKVEEIKQNLAMDPEDASWESMDFYEYEHRDFSVILPILNDVYERYKDLYNRIFLDYEVDEDGYIAKHKIIGERSETDDEYHARVEKLHKDYEKYLKEKERKKEEQKQRRKEKLKEELVQIEEKE